MLVKAKITQLVIALFLVVSLSGCTMIGNYDQVIDQTATSLNSEINSFLDKMERCAGTPEGTYEKNVESYEKLNSTLNTLKARALLLPKNELIAQQIESLIIAIEGLRNTHQSPPYDINGLDKRVIELNRKEINHLFVSIVKSENALKRGKSN